MTLFGGTSNQFEYFLEVGKGNIPGESLVHKYGAAAELNSGDAPANIWDGSNQTHQMFTYTFPLDGVTHYMSSSDNGDTQDFEVQGLDADFLLQSQVQTLAGQTKTEIGAGLAWSRIFRCRNQGSINNAGTIYFYEDDTVIAGVPQTSSKVSAIIRPGKNGTLMAIYTIPADKTGYFTQVFTSVNRGGGTGTKEVDFELLVRQYGGVFQINYLAGISNIGVGSLVLPNSAPVPVPAKSDIMMIAETVSANTTMASAYFDMVLVDR